MWTTIELEFWHERDSHGSDQTKINRTTHNENQSRQQAQFDFFCPLGCCVSPQAYSSFRVPEVASGSCCHCHCRSTIMK